MTDSDSHYYACEVDTRKCFLRDPQDREDYEEQDIEENRV